MRPLIVLSIFLDALMFNLNIDSFESDYLPLKDDLMLSTSDLGAGGFLGIGNLLGIKGSNLNDIKDVYSHAQALSQSSSFIKKSFGVQIFS